MADVISSDKDWLVGGGWSEPFTYGQLSGVIQAQSPADYRVTCIGKAYLKLSTAICAGSSIVLSEMDFSGEGDAGGSDPRLRFSSPSWRTELDFPGEANIALATSGTAGRPRLVSHRLSSLSRSVVISPKHAGDIWGLAFSPAHIAGVQVYLQALGNRNTMVNLWGTEPAEAIARCRLWRVTHLSATPTYYRMLMSVADVLPDVRSVSVGGEAADDSLWRGLRVFFPNARFHNIYASTEAGTLFYSDGSEFSVPEAMAHQVRISDQRLWLHGNLLASFPRSGEWYDTGDLVEVTAHDPLRFRIVGRASGFVNVGGEKINPQAVEAVMLRHSAVQAVRVFGRRNSVTGQVVVADIVSNDPALTEHELRVFLASRLQPIQIPRLIRFVDRLELTPTGKILRNG